MSESYAGGTTPLICDTERQVLVKILISLNSGSGGGGGGSGGNPAPGTVNPEGSVTASPGATYWNTANTTFWVKQTGTGNTGWVQLI